MDQAALGKEIEQLTRAIAETKGLLATAEKEGDELFTMLAPDGAPEKRLAMVSTECAATSKKVDDLQQILDTVEKKSVEQQQATAVRDQAREKLIVCEKGVQSARHARDKAAAEVSRLCRQQEALLASLGEQRRQFLSNVAPYGMTSCEDGQIEAMVADLAARQTAWKNNKATRRTLQEQQRQATADRQTARALLDKLTKELADAAEEEKVMSSHLVHLLGERRALYGEKDPDKEEQRLAEQLTATEKKRDALRQTVVHSEKKLHALVEQRHRLAVAMQERQVLLAKQQTVFHHVLAEAGFAGEEVFVAARLASDERQRLILLRDSLVRQQTQLHSRMRDQQKALELEKKKKVTDETSEQVLESLKQQEQDVAGVQQAVGSLEKQLVDDADLRLHLQERLTSLQKAQKECERWDMLHGLIGSADGKKFRNFAQGLTFEVMVNHANRQLAKMSDRYILIRDELQPLELSVIDSYQAGEIRSTKNLSGGESFIVSLALALGLSRMSSRNVRVDSLFLDEGFGTLDEEALETALESLVSLQQDGKLIGIISHVAALKERVTTQIQLHAGADGRSTIRGPGVRLISH